MDRQIDNLLNYPADPLLAGSSRELQRHLEPFRHGSVLDRALEITELLSGDEFRTLIRTAVAAICSDPAQLFLCAQRSQSHPLGFSKILIQSAGWCQVRLNFWSEFLPDREPEDIHDHRFDFASTILTGSLVAEVYEIVDAGDPMIHFVDRLPVRHGDPYILEKIGPVRARRVGVHRLAQGSAYVTRSETLHRILVADAPVVTAFVKFSSTRPDANVLVAPTAADTRERQARQFFTPETVFSALQRILALVPK